MSRTAAADLCRISEISGFYMIRAAVISQALLSLHASGFMQAGEMKGGNTANEQQNTSIIVDQPYPDRAFYHRLYCLYITILGGKTLWRPLERRVTSPSKGLSHHFIIKVVVVKQWRRETGS